MATPKDLQYVTESGVFELVPEGIYTAVCVDQTWGKGGSGFDNAVTKFEIFDDGPCVGQSVLDNFSNTDQGKFIGQKRHRGFLIKAGVIKESDYVNFEDPKVQARLAKAVTGRKVVIRVNHEEDRNGKVRSKITRYWAVGEQAPTGPSDLAGGEDKEPEAKKPASPKSDLRFGDDEGSSPSFE